MRRQLAAGLAAGLLTGLAVSFTILPAHAAAPAAGRACQTGNYDAGVKAPSPDEAVADWEVLSTCGYPYLQVRAECRNAQVQVHYYVSGKTDVLEHQVTAPCTSTYPQIIAAAHRQCTPSGTCTSWVTYWNL